MYTCQLKDCQKVIKTNLNTFMVLCFLYHSIRHVRPTPITSGIYSYFISSCASDVRHVAWSELTNIPTA